MYQQPGQSANTRSSILESVVCAFWDNNNNIIAPTRLDNAVQTSLLPLLGVTKTIQ